MLATRIQVYLSARTTGANSAVSKQTVLLFQSQHVTSLDRLHSK